MDQEEQAGGPGTELTNRAVARSSVRRDAVRRTEAQTTGPSLHRQRGWAGILALLVVVLVVAFLAKDALLKYLGPAHTEQRAGPRTQLDPAASGATPLTPGNAMDRARGLQDAMQRESEKRSAD